MAGQAGNLEYIVQPDYRDAVAWDAVRRRKNWPTSNEVQFCYLTTLAWSALCRSGDYLGNLEEFMHERCIVVEPVDEDGNFQRLREETHTAGCSPAPVVGLAPYRIIDPFEQVRVALDLMRDYVAALKLHLAVERSWMQFNSDRLLSWCRQLVQRDAYLDIIRRPLRLSPGTRGRDSACLVASPRAPSSSRLLTLAA